MRICQVSEETTATCEGLSRVAAMLDDVVYRDQQVPLSRDPALLRSLLPGNHQSLLTGLAIILILVVLIMLCTLGIFSVVEVEVSETAL